MWRVQVKNVFPVCAKTTRKTTLSLTDWLGSPPLLFLSPCLFIRTPKQVFLPWKKKKSLTSPGRSVPWPRCFLLRAQRSSASAAVTNGQVSFLCVYVFVARLVAHRTENWVTSFFFVRFFSFFFFKKENKVWTPALLLSRWHCCCVKHWEVEGEEEEEEKAPTRARDPKQTKKKKTLPQSPAALQDVLECICQWGEWNITLKWEKWQWAIYRYIYEWYI